MIFKLFGLVILVALWWGALWLALPVGWLQGTMASFIAIHIGPPLLALSAWWGGKWTWTWRKDKVEKRAKDAKEAEKEAAIQAAKAAHQEKLALRRVHVECRAVWAVVADPPHWFVDGAKQCILDEQDPKTLQEFGHKAALISSLKQVFAAAFAQCEAAVWLPVKIVSDDPAQQEWVEQAWKQAVEDRSIKQFPPKPDCAILPGSGGLPDRLINLFEIDPNLPAVILVGMDSPLAETFQSGKGDSKPRPGHAVVALLVSRSGLSEPGSNGFLSEEYADSLTPYWERERMHDTDAPTWHRIPPALRPPIWGHAPLAKLHISNRSVSPESKRESVLTRQIRDAIEVASVNANLRDLPFIPKKDADQDEKAKEKPEEEEAKPAKLGSLDLGWIVHNSGSSLRLGALSSALRDSGCETDTLDEAGNMDKEFGNVGSACGTLMLAEALVRVAQLQKPVLTAEFNEDDSVGIGLVCPIAEKLSTEAQQA
jgi:hypothetical protein